MAYEIEGRLLEVCTCNVLCPCWVGEDPDYKTCDTVIAWGIEKGSIEGVDVGGLTMAVSAHIPKNILIPKSWKAVVFVDDRASAEQEAAMIRLFTGQLGGAVADLAGLIGEVVAVERAPIAFTRRRRQGPADDRDRSSTPRWRRSWARPASRRRSPRPCSARSRARPCTRQGEPVHEGREPARDPERGPRGPQRPAGPLPLRRLSGGRLRSADDVRPRPSPRRRDATERSWAGRSSRSRARPGSRCGSGKGRRTGTTCTTPTDGGSAAARGGALRRSAGC